MKLSEKNLLSMPYHQHIQPLMQMSIQMLIQSLVQSLIQVLALTLLVSKFAYAESSLVNVETTKDATSNIVIAKNLSQIPLTLTLNLSSSTNITSSTSWPIIRLLQAGETAELVRVSAADNSQAYAFQYLYRYQIGQPNVQAAPGAKYLVPFISTKAFQVMQAADGPIFSHHDIAAKNAIDIPMPIGTTVIASRGGYVIENVNQFSDNGQATSDFLSKANYICILHDDGTWAIYVHLKQFSSRVAIGQKIAAGMPIALSGNSGFSTEPHLHFALQKNENGNTVSFPIQFWGESTGVVIPRYHSWLTSAGVLPSRPKTKHSAKECTENAMIDETTLRCMRGQ